MELDARLSSAAKFVRQGAVFADIGTDHAYLPLFLLKSGIIKSAICSDINAGPLERAKENVSAEGLSEKVSFYKTDGVRGLTSLGVTDYAICGMGGELIARIIEDAPELKNKSIRLILQPMSRQGYLRAALYKNGFTVLSESYSCSEGKYYLCLLCGYTGEVKELTYMEAELGDFSFADKDKDSLSAYKGYLSGKRNAYKKAADGKTLGGEDNSYELELICEIDRRLSLLNENNY